MRCRSAGRSGCFYIVGNYVIAVRERGQGLRYQHQADSSARACAERYRWPTARAPRDFRNVSKQGLFHPELPQLRARLLQHFRLNGRYLSWIAQGDVLVIVSGEDFHFLLRRWISNLDLQQKTIQLRLGQWVSAFELHQGSAWPAR